MAARTTLLKPQRRTITTALDVSYLRLDRSSFITIETGDGRSVEVVCLADGSLQVCVDDETFQNGVHRYEEIYGPD